MKRHRVREPLSRTLEIIHDRGPLPRSAIAAALGLDRSSTAYFVRELVRMELLEEEPCETPGKVGRPAAAIVPRPDVAAFGIEVTEAALIVGTTSIGDRSGNRIRRFPRTDCLAQDVRAALGTYPERTRVASVVLTGAGPEDERGVAASLGVPVFRLDEATASAFAEAELGAAAHTARSVHLCVVGDEIRIGRVEAGIAVGRDGRRKIAAIRKLSALVEDTLRAVALTLDPEIITLDDSLLRSLDIARGADEIPVVAATARARRVVGASTFGLRSLITDPDVELRDIAMLRDRRELRP